MTGQECGPPALEFPAATVDCQQYLHSIICDTFEFTFCIPTEYSTSNADKSRNQDFKQVNKNSGVFKAISHMLVCYMHFPPLLQSAARV